MTITDGPMPGLKILLPVVWGDQRGYFYEAYNAETLKEGGIDTVFVQDNQARSDRGVLRGLHYQCGAAAQAKLVRVIEGEVLDVVVDLRPDSPTYGQSYSILLSSENKIQFFVPKGFAHGYVVLSETAEFFYKCDNYYNKAAEGGLAWDDPQLHIDWRIDPALVKLSAKDQVNPTFGNHLPAL